MIYLITCKINPFISKDPNAKYSYHEVHDISRLPWDILVTIDEFGWAHNAEDFGRLSTYSVFVDVTKEMKNGDNNIMLLDKPDYLDAEVEKLRVRIKLKKFIEND